MAEREYFPCKHSYLRKCEKLTDQELGRLFRALMKYSATGERQELAGRESIAFDFIADDIDSAEEAYAKKCETNRKNRQGASTTVHDRQRPSLNKKENKKETSSPIGEEAKKTPVNAEAAAACADFHDRITPTDPKIAAVFTAYAEKIGAKSPMTEKIRDELIAFLQTMGPECCIRAMDEAVEAGAINWRYVRGTLSAKRDQGVRCIADWEAAEKKWSARTQRDAGPRTDFQPSHERIDRSGKRLDEFMAKQKGGG